jgi:hypothetical protein
VYLQSREKTLHDYESKMRAWETDLVAREANLQKMMRGGESGTRGHGQGQQPACLKRHESAPPTVAGGGHSIEHMKSPLKRQRVKTTAVETATQQQQQHTHPRSHKHTHALQAKTENTMNGGAIARKPVPHGKAKLTKPMVYGGPENHLKNNEYSTDPTTRQ